MDNGLMLIIGDDGIARQYDDTYDIVIHCESAEEQDKVRKMLPLVNLEKLEGVTKTEPEPTRGRWIRNDNGTYSCSVCQSWIPEEQHFYARYCLYCGAVMRRDGNEPRRDNE